MSVAKVCLARVTALSQGGLRDENGNSVLEKLRFLVVIQLGFCPGLGCLRKT